MSVETLRIESQQTVRNPIAKIRVTWTDPLIDQSIQTITTENNYVSQPQQVADLVNVTTKKWFHTNDLEVTLNGDFYPPPSTSESARRAQMGWWGVNSCDVNGEWALGSYPVLTVDFNARLVEGFIVTGDSQYNEFPVDFNVTLQKRVLGTYVTLESVDILANTELTYTAPFSQSYNNANRVILTLKKWNTPEKICKIVEFYTAITEEFSADQIVSLNLLQEFEDSDGTLPVGNISCNELDISLLNINNRFFPGNTDSDIYTFIKRNRKIELFLGFKYASGLSEYIQKGLYWSGDWEIADLGTTAQTSARDRFEMMRKKGFPYEDVFPEILYNVPLTQLFETVLDSFSAYMVDFFYDISDMDPSFVLPVFLPVFFENKTYFQIVKLLSAASLSYSYMDTPTDEEKANNGPLNRDIMRVKRLETVFPEDPNLSSSISIDENDFINKNQPAKSEEVANVVVVSYVVYTFNEVDQEWESSNFTVSSRDEDSIREFGELVADYDSGDLIQSAANAKQIADILISSFSITRRDIEVETFGDLTLLLADTIIVPDYKKNGVNNIGAFAIKRLNVMYDGSLRINVDGRKLESVDFNVIQEGTGATGIIVEDKNNIDIIVEGV